MSSLRLHQVSQRTKDTAGEEGAIRTRTRLTVDSLLGRISRNGSGEAEAHSFTAGGSSAGGHSLTPHYYPPPIEML